MTRIRWYGPTIVLLITVLLVMILGPNVVRNLAWEHTDARIQLVQNELGSNPTLAELSDSFRKVAQVVEPSVVNIEVYRQVDRNARRGGMDGRDLFERFFRGQPGQPEPEPREREEPDEQFDQYNVPQRVGNGSGWVYDAQGHIITNNHVVAEADRIKVRFADGTERDAEVIGTDPNTDVAVIKVEDTKVHPAKLAPNAVAKGDIVFAFGSPFRFEFSMSQGIVSGKGRQLGILNTRDRRGRIIRSGYEDFIQTDAAINPGNSGGPLTNIYGEVIGMNTAIATRSGTYNGLGFAIPAEMVQNVVDQIIDTGKVRRGYLGVYIEDLDEKMARTFNYDGQGVLVVDPIKGGPADKAGLQRGDIITQVQGAPVTSADELRHLIASYPPGTELELGIVRNGKTLDRTLTIGELPESIAANPQGQATPEQPPEPEKAEVLSKLGVTEVMSLTESLAERNELPIKKGVLIREVRPLSQAAAAGLRPGMVITHVQGVAVDAVDKLITELSKHDLAQGVRISVQAGDANRFVLLELPDTE